MIGLLGGTGFTGRLVAFELKRQGLPFLVACRNPEKLAVLVRELDCPVKTITADTANPSSLKELCSSCKVLVNCAGPFSLHAPPVVSACVESGTHYVDTTGEGDFILEMHRLHHESAVAKRLTVVPGSAFETLLSNCGISIAAENMSEPFEITIVFYIRHSGTAASMGTKRTQFLHLRKDRNRLSLQKKKFWFPDPVGERIALEIPMGDCTSARQLFTNSTCSAYMVVSRRLAFFSWTISVLAWLSRFRPIGDFAERRYVGNETGPALEERKEHAFCIRVNVKDKKENVSKLMIQGISPYDVTAAIVSHAAQLILEGKQKGFGVLPPASAYDPKGFFEYLKGHSVRYVH